MKPIPFGLQAKFLMTKFPAGRCQHSYRHLIWESRAQPETWTREYKLKLNYQIGKPPKMFVLSPSLVELSGGKKVPHLYCQETQHLCLYRPRMGLWTPEMFISETIVPWALAWLVYYEMWLATDHWHGRAFGHAGDDPVLRNDY